MKKKLLLLAVILPIVIVVGVGVLLLSGTVQINHPSREEYPIRGVDVSHYQGDIDWSILSAEGIDFAYIKATEGSSFQDKQFQDNWSEAAKTGLRIGAYHFFSFESSGRKQAENFINTVTILPDMLPPTADVERYSGYQHIKSLSSAALDELALWVEEIEAWCGIKPIVYTTMDFYDQIHAALPDCDIWIRSVYGAPSKDISWKIWQYSARSRLKGYAGPERFIDMNVFSGTKEEFMRYGK